MSMDTMLLALKLREAATHAAEIAGDITDDDHAARVWETVVRVLRIADELDGNRSVHPEVKS